MPQVKARSAGQTVAADQLLNMTNPRRLEEFRNHMMGVSSLAAAQTATQAASLQLDPRSLGDRTARVTREQRIQVRRLQRQQGASHASGPAVPPASQPKTISLIAGNARQNGRTQSSGQAAHVSYSQSSGGNRQTGQSAAQPNTCPKIGQELVISYTSF